MSSKDPIGELSSLTSDEHKFLAFLAKRAYQSVISSPGGPESLRTFSNKKSDLGDKDKPTAEHEALPETIRIAAFAFRLPDLPLDHTHMVRFCPEALQGEWDRHQIVSFDCRDHRIHKHALKMIACVEEFLEQNKKNGRIHFVLMNELALSFSRPTRDVLLAKWKSIAERYETYVIPGSYHCEERLFGVAPVIAPQAYRGIREVLKQNTAAHMHELIRTPDVRMLRSFATNYGNISIWICLDLYDPGLVFKLLSLTHRGRRTDLEKRRKPGQEINLVLIPSYNGDRTDSIREAISSLSQFCKVAVVAANSFHGSAPDDVRLETFGFLAGTKIVSSAAEPTAPTSPIPLVPDSDESKNSVKVEPKFCEAAIYSINSKDLQSRQAENFVDSRVFSAAFKAIVKGEPLIRSIPE